MKCLLTIRGNAAEAATADARCLTLPLSALAHAVMVTAILILPAVFWRELPPAKIGGICVPVHWSMPSSQPRDGGGGGGTSVASHRAVGARAMVYSAPAPSMASAKLADDLDSIESEVPDDGNGGWCIGSCGRGGAGTGGGGGDDPPFIETRRADPVRAGAGGVVREPVKVRNVEPLYPALARSARIQGRVVLECTLSATGIVERVEVVEGSPLLVPAAVHAVEQWRYRPTLLNGMPVPVQLSVVVDFRIS